MGVHRVSGLRGVERPDVPVIGAQEEGVQARRGDGEGVDPRRVQHADDVVEVLGVDGEPAVDVAVEPLGDVFGNARASARPEGASTVTA